MAALVTLPPPPDGREVNGREPMRKLLIGAAVAGTLLGTGAIVGASIPSSNGRSTACVKPGGATRIIDFEAAGGVSPASTGSVGTPSAGGARPAPLDQVI